MTSHKKRPTWRRCLLALAMGTGVGLAVGCASDRGVATQDAIDTAMQEAVTPAPQVTEPFAVLPKPVAPVAAEERFDVDVMSADAREFFMGLVAGTSRNLIVHPDVTGTLTLTLKQVTLPEVLETVRDVYGYDYRRTGGSYIVLPATLQNRVFEIDYLNLIRGGMSRTRVSSGQVTQTSGDSETNAVGGAVSSDYTSGGDNGQQQTTGSVIDTRQQLGLLGGAAADADGDHGQRARAPDRRQRAVGRRVRARHARGAARHCRLPPAHPRRREAPGRARSQDHRGHAERRLPGRRELGGRASAVRRRHAGRRQPVGRRAAWAANPPLGGDPMTIGPGNPVNSFASQTIGAAFALALDFGDFNAFVELLEAQGETRVLSSPRVATLNNQKAIIKAGTDEFFVTDVSSNTDHRHCGDHEPRRELTPFFSGIALDVTPQISADGEVSCTSTRRSAT